MSQIKPGRFGSQVVDDLVKIMPSFFQRPSLEALDLAIDGQKVTRPSSDDTAKQKWEDLQKEALEFAHQRQQEQNRLAEEERAKAKVLWEEYQQSYTTPPTVASTAWQNVMAQQRSELEGAYVNLLFPKLDVLDQALKALKQQHADAIREFEERQRQLVAAVGKHMEKGQEVAPGAPADELELLEQTRAGLLTRIEARDATMDLLAPLDEDIDAFARAIEETRERVQKRQERKQAIEEGLKQIALPPEAPVGALTEERSAVTKPLQIEALTDRALELSEQALVVLQKTAEVLSATVAVQKLKHEEYGRQLQDARTLQQHELAKVGLDTFVVACEQLLPPPPFDDQTDGRLAQFPGKLKQLKDKASTNVNETARQEKRGLLQPYYQAQYAELEEELRRIAKLPGTPPGFGEVEPKELVTAMKMAKLTVNAVVPNAGPLKDTGVKMQKFLQTARQALADARENAIQTAAEWQRQKDQLLNRVAPGDPPNVASDFAGELERLRQAVRTPLAGTLNHEVLLQATQNASQFISLLARATTDAVHGVIVKDIRQRIDHDWQAIHESARKPMQAQLTDDREYATQIAEVKGTGRDMRKARTLFEALEKRLAEAKVEATEKQNQVLGLTSRTVDSNPVLPETAAEIYDLLGPGLLTELGQGDQGETNMQTVCAAFHGASQEEVKALRDLFLEGLSGHGRALMAVLRTGDGKALRTLATSFGGENAKEDRKHLGQMISQGGMGEHPEQLTDLLGFGLANAQDKDEQRKQNIAKLKTIGQHFGTNQGAKRLKTLLDDCGFATRPTEDRPGAFAEVLLNDGCSAEDLSSFASRLTPEDKKNLKGVLKDGGFGDHPAPLAPLIKESRLDALKHIATTFAKPTDRAKLKTLMTSGGFSGETQLLASRHEHPDTLAKVFKTGLKGEAKNLLTFATAFAPVPGQCKNMLDAWNEYPDTAKDDRKPGVQVAKVLRRMGNDQTDIDQKIGMLQNQFTAKITQINTPLKRQSAYRFAPDLATHDAPTSLNAPGNMPNTHILDTSMQGQSLLRRHVAKYFSRATMDNNNTLWPVTTDEGKLTQYLGQAIGGHPGNMPGNDPYGTPDRNKRFTDIGGGKMVEFAAATYGGPYIINHFHPGAGWPQTADRDESVTFTSGQMTSMLEAVGK